MAATPPLQLRFVMSGARVGDLPPTRGEVAIVGRSNVGKSSLINAIANRKGLAKVSKTPGRTQLLNLFELPDGTSVLDLPGYGFANAPASVRATWPEMIEGYLLGRQNLRAVIALIDAEVGPTKNDTQTLAWLRSHGLPVKVVATKHDKVKPSKREQRKKDLAEGCLLTPKDVLWVSAAKHVNIDELRSRIMTWLDPVEDWNPAPPTRKERAEARAADRLGVDQPDQDQPDQDQPDQDEPDDDEDEWN